MQTIDDKNIYRINTFKLKFIDDWDAIDCDKSKVVITNNPNNRRYLTFPGFVSDNIELANLYEKYIYNKIREVFIPPRGNISTKCQLMVVGIKPGTKYMIYSKSECSWLLGPSSQMLFKLLYETNVYPYFTNVFHDTNSSETTGDISEILKEIDFMNIINSNIRIIFLGNYEIYNKLIDILAGKNINNAFKIWHPAYLCRSYTDEKFDKWKNQFIKCLK
jgi:hypothetical protein